MTGVVTPLWRQWRHECEHLNERDTIETPHFWMSWRRIYVTSRETTLLRSFPKLVQTIYIKKFWMIMMAGILVGSRDEINGLDHGKFFVFCTNGKFPTSSGYHVQIFLAAICEPVLTVRFRRVVGVTKGGTSTFVNVRRNVFFGQNFTWTSVGNKWR